MDNLENFHFHPQSPGHFPLVRGTQQDKSVRLKDLKGFHPQVLLYE
jgi:hypothetical protein